MSDDLSDLVPVPKKKGGKRLDSELVPDPGDVDKPLTNAVLDLFRRRPELRAKVADRLIQMALDGNMRAMELLFNRLDGKLSEEARTEVPPMQVVVQQIQGPGRSMVVEPREVPQLGTALED